MAKVSVISSWSVGMATTVVKNDNAINSITKIDLTPWDLPLILIDPIQKGILFYKPNDESQEFQRTFIYHLKKSLSRTLDLFPPLAGRLGTIKNEDNTMCYFIDCNNEGAEFTHAIAHGVSVSDILDPIYVPEIVSSFFPLNGIPNCEGISKPLLGVQVTELVDGYFIGCTANHVVVDGTSFWHFFNSWSEISRGFDTISKPPVLDRWFPSNVTNKTCLIPVQLLEEKNLSNKFDSPPLLERVFHFSKENIANLKGKANSEAGTDKISSLQALLAHLWRSVTRVRQRNSHNPQNRDIDFVLLVGARSRIPLPDGYFGNAVYGAVTSSKEQDLLDHSLGWAALKLNELVSQQTSEVAIEFVEYRMKNPLILVRYRNNPFIISSSPRFNVYGNDFGWGKPIAVRSGMGQKFDGKFTMFPASDVGGIDVEACLAPQTLHTLQDDAEFMEAVTI